MLAVKEKSITPNDLEFLNYWLINSHNALKAYQKVHPNASDETAKVNACRILTKANVKAEIERRQAKLAEKTEYTVLQYQYELEQARKRAEQWRQPSAEVSAIVAKGRSCGYDKDGGDRGAVTVINVISYAGSAGVAPPKAVESEVIENEVSE